MPLLPVASEERFSVRVDPTALIMPIPVTKTLLTLLNLFGSVFFDIVNHGVDIDQHLPAFFQVFDNDPVFPVEENDQFERVDGIKTQALIAKKGFVILDAFRSTIRQVQKFYDLLLQLLF
jgi:hypothetical protein